MGAPSYKILVVDDDPSITDSVRRLLTQAGHRVSCADSVRAAQRLLEQEVFDLHIIDILMPDEDGLQLMIRLREAYPSVRIVAMSGGGLIPPQIHLQMAKGLGAVQLLEKPFSSEKLYASVAKALGDGP